MTHLSADVDAVGSLLVRRARIVALDAGAPPGPVDLRLRAGTIVEIAAGLPSRGEPQLDAAGAWAIPGLWDAHVHAVQAARASGWLDLSGTPTAASAVERVRRHLVLQPGRAPVIAFGHRLNGWRDAPTVDSLDAATGSRPVVLIAGDAHNGWLNGAAQRLLGVGPFEAPVFEAAWFPIFDRLGELTSADDDEAALGGLLRHSVARGVTGLVDFEFGDAFAAWPSRVTRGLDSLRVRASVYPHQLDEVIGLGLRTGDVLDGGGLITMGPLKIISDGSLGTATAWCCEPYGTRPDGRPHVGGPNLDPAELAGLLRRATEAGLEVAIHGIGDRACQVALDAVAATGALGTIEHAQLVRSADLERFARLKVAASVQPLHVLDDRDATEWIWPDRAERCFPFRSLLDAGARLAFGSDAPVAPIDPWGAMAAAVHRSGDDRGAWHPEQAITPAEALAASVDGQRLRVGGRGDLVLLGADLLWQGESSADTAGHLRSMSVLAVVCAGRVTFADGVDAPR